MHEHRAVISCMAQRRCTAIIAITVISSATATRACESPPAAQSSIQKHTAAGSPPLLHPEAHRCRITSSATSRSTPLQDHLLCYATQQQQQQQRRWSLSRHQRDRSLPNSSVMVQLKAVSSLLRMVPRRVR